MEASANQLLIFSVHGVRQIQQRIQNGLQNVVKNGPKKSLNLLHKKLLFIFSELFVKSLRYFTFTPRFFGPSGLFLGVFKLPYSEVRLTFLSSCSPYLTPKALILRGVYILCKSWQKKRKSFLPLLLMK